MKWRSVDDAMPAFGESVITYTPSSGYGPAWAIAVLDHVWGWDFNGANPDYHEPTHWMPLPEPPP